MKKKAIAVLAAGAAAVLAPHSPAAAQDVPQITIRPLDEGAAGRGAYLGPYGRELPGVYMFASRPVPTPDLWDGSINPLVSRTKIPQEYTYQDPIPVLDAWHGTLGPGIPF